MLGFYRGSTGNDLTSITQIYSGIGQWSTVTTTDYNLGTTVSNTKTWLKCPAGSFITGIGKTSTTANQ